MAYSHHTGLGPGPELRPEPEQGINGFLYIVQKCSHWSDTDIIGITMFAAKNMKIFRYHTAFTHLSLFLK